MCFCQALLCSKVLCIDNCITICYNIGSNKQGKQRKGELNMVYSLYIGRYKRSKDFRSLSELREEVAHYFSNKEKCFVVDALTTFRNKQFNSEGIAHNSYQDFSVYAFKAGAEI